MAEVVRMIRAMLWKNRVPLGLYEMAEVRTCNTNKQVTCVRTMNDHKNMPNMDAVITAKTAHSQSVP